MCHGHCDGSQQLHVTQETLRMLPGGEEQVCLGLTGPGQACAAFLFLPGAADTAK